MMRFPKKFVFLSTALAILGCSSGNNTTQTEPPITPGISWASPAAITYGTALSSVQLDASTDGVAGTFVYSPVAGTILPAGNQTLAVTFTPADTTKYTNAIANATLTVNKATPNITWTPAALIAGSALGSSQLDASAGSVAGSFAYTPAAGTVESTVGSVTLSATFTPTDTANYTTAPASATLTVSKPMPALSWATPAPITYGTALSSTQLDASSGGVAGTFTYTPAAGTVLTAGSQSLSVTFSPTDTVDYSPTTASVTLTVNKAAPTVSWATPAPITYGTALSTTQLNASAGSVAGAFTYTPTAGTVLLAGSQSLSATFTPTDTTDYTSVPAATTLTVNKATPSITWDPAALVAGSALGSSQLDASAGSVAGSFAYTPTAGTVESTIGSVTLSATFTPTDTADYTTAPASAMLKVVSANTAVVDFGSAIQTIRGFGGSTAWMPELSAAQQNTLFGTGQNQLGLSILRVRIDPSSVTGGAANWSTELANAKAAQAAGSDVIVFATPWTPPAAWKTNTQGVLYNNSPPNSNGTNALWGGSLNTADYANYASYLESFVTYMANNGVNLYGISMQNEPDENVAYESCVWTGAQMDTWVAANSSVLTTKLIMPESATFNTGLSDPALDDPNAVNNISIVGGHIYGTTPSYYTNAFKKGKEVWMTEHYLSPASSGAQPGIADALLEAKEVNDSMSVGNYSAYVWWWIVDWSESTNIGLADENGNPTYYGYAVGQYSKFVRPGYVRSNATYNPVGSVYVTAYNGDGHYVIVALNLGSSAQSQTFLIQNQTVSSLTPYQTTARESIAPLTPLTVSGNTFTYTLPAQSITTFIQ